MTTPITEVRLSPSGKRIGQPGLRSGPGSLGLIWRKHGDSTPAAMATGNPAAFADFDPIAVDMQPGYLYDVEMHYPIQAATSTTAPQWTGYYRLRVASTQQWQAWTVMENGVHTCDATGPLPVIEAADAVFGVSVAVPVDAIELGGLSDSANLLVNTRCSYARICEYMP